MGRPKTPEFLTSESEIAKYLNVTPRTIRRWKKAGKLPAPIQKTTKNDKTFGIWRTADLKPLQQK